MLLQDKTICLFTKINIRKMKMMINKMSRSTKAHCKISCTLIYSSNTSSSYNNISNSVSSSKPKLNFLKSKKQKINVTIIIMMITVMSGRENYFVNMMI